MHAHRRSSRSSSQRGSWSFHWNFCLTGTTQSQMRASPITTGVDNIGGSSSSTTHPRTTFFFFFFFFFFQISLSHISILSLSLSLSLSQPTFNHNDDVLFHFLLFLLLVIWRMPQLHALSQFFLYIPFDWAFSTYTQFDFQLTLHGSIIITAPLVALPPPPPKKSPLQSETSAKSVKPSIDLH